MLGTPMGKDRARMMGTPRIWARMMGTPMGKDRARMMGTPMGKDDGNPYGQG
jgi:hypothetical protein